MLYGDTRWSIATELMDTHAMGHTVPKFLAPNWETEAHRPTTDLGRIYGVARSKGMLHFYRSPTMKSLSRVPFELEHELDNHSPKSKTSLEFGLPELVLHIELLGSKTQDMVDLDPRRRRRRGRTYGKRRSKVVLAKKYLAILGNRQGRLPGVMLAKFSV